MPFLVHTARIAKVPMLHRRQVRHGFRDDEHTGPYRVVTLEQKLLLHRPSAIAESLLRAPSSDHAFCSSPSHDAAYSILPACCGPVSGGLLSQYRCRHDQCLWATCELSVCRVVNLHDTKLCIVALRDQDDEFLTLYSRDHLTCNIWQGWKRSVARDSRREFMRSSAVGCPCQR